MHMTQDGPLVRLPGMTVIECLPGTLTPIMRGGATEQKADMTGVYYTTATVDIVSKLTDVSADITVTIAGILATDLIIPIPPATYENGQCWSGTHTVAAGSFKLRSVNPTAGTVDPASATWGFLVFRR